MRQNHQQRLNNSQLSQHSHSFQPSTTSIITAPATASDSSSINDPVEESLNISIQQLKDNVSAQAQQAKSVIEESFTNISPTKTASDYLLSLLAQESTE